MVNGRLDSLRIYEGRSPYGHTRFDCSVVFAPLRRGELVGPADAHSARGAEVPESGRADGVCAADPDASVHDGVRPGAQRRLAGDDAGVRGRAGGGAGDDVDPVERVSEFIVV